MFGFDSEHKLVWYFSKIGSYLNENYSKDYTERKKILEEVINEYPEYKGSNVF